MEPSPSSTKTIRQKRFWSMYSSPDATLCSAMPVVSGQQRSDPLHPTCTRIVSSWTEQVSWILKIHSTSPTRVSRTHCWKSLPQRVHWLTTSKTYPMGTSITSTTTRRVLVPPTKLWYICHRSTRRIQTRNTLFSISSAVRLIPRKCTIRLGV